MRTEVISLGRRNIMMADGMANAEEVYEAIRERLDRGDIPVHNRGGQLIGYIKDVQFKDGEVYVEIHLLKAASQRRYNETVDEGCSGADSSR